MIINGFSGGGWGSDNNFTNLLRTKYTLQGSYATSIVKPSGTSFDTVWSEISSSFTLMGQVSYTANTNITLDTTLADSPASNAAGALIGSIQYTVPKEYRYVPYMAVLYCPSVSASSSNIFTNGETTTNKKISGNAYAVARQAFDSYSTVNRGTPLTTYPSGNSAYQLSLTSGYGGGKAYNVIGSSYLRGGTADTSDTSRTSADHLWNGDVYSALIFDVRVICTGAASGSPALGAVVKSAANFTVQLYIRYEPLWPNIWSI